MSLLLSGIIIIGQSKAIIMDFSNFSIFVSELLRVTFQVFWTKSMVLGQIGRSGKVLGVISFNFGPNPTPGRLLKGNDRGAIIIIITPAKGFVYIFLGYAFPKQLGLDEGITSWDLKIGIPRRKIPI